MLSYSIWSSKALNKLDICNRALICSTSDAGCTLITSTATCWIRGLTRRDRGRSSTGSHRGHLLLIQPHTPPITAQARVCQPLAGAAAWVVEALVVVGRCCPGSVGQQPPSALSMNESEVFILCATLRDASTDSWIGQLSGHSNKTNHNISTRLLVTSRFSMVSDLRSSLVPFCNMQGIKPGARIWPMPCETQEMLRWQEMG